MREKFPIEIGGGAGGWPSRCPGEAHSLNGKGAEVTRFASFAIYVTICQYSCFRTRE